MDCIDINPNTSIYGIFGQNISQSLSPLIYNYLFKRYKLNSVYLGFNINESNFKEGINGFKAVGGKGLNITSPYKEKILEYVDKIDKNVERIGSVNVLKVVDNYILGFNTDYYGIIKTLRQTNVDLIGKKAVIIGAGGAARAVFWALVDSGIKEITILNRNIEKAIKITNNIIKKRILTKVEELNTSNTNNELKNTSIFIDATNVDLLRERVIEINFDDLNKDILIFDLKYFSPQSLMLNKAEKYGIQYCNGLYMLIFQAFASFEIWTGICPNTEDFHHILSNA